MKKNIHNIETCCTTELAMFPGKWVPIPYASSTIQLSFQTTEDEQI